jgi:hypothetical protein
MTTKPPALSKRTLKKLRAEVLKNALFLKRLKKWART